MSRKEQKESTRASLIEGAERLFAAKGIGATSTAEVAKHIDVSHGTLFVHFPTREDLILAVVEKFGDRLSQELGKRFEADLDLDEILKAHLQVLAEFEDFYLRLISESLSLPANIRSIVYSMNASLSYRIYRAAQLDMKLGKIKKTDQALLFNTWMSLITYQVLNRDLFSERTPILHAKASTIIKHFYLLIKTDRKETI